MLANAKFHMLQLTAAKAIMLPAAIPFTISYGLYIHFRFNIPVNNSARAGNTLCFISPPLLFYDE